MEGDVLAESHVVSTVNDNATLVRFPDHILGEGGSMNAFGHCRNGNKWDVCKYGMKRSNATREKASRTPRPLTVKMKRIASQPRLLSHVRQQRPLQVLVDHGRVQDDDVPPDVHVVARLLHGADVERPVEQRRLHGKVGVSERLVCGRLLLGEGEHGDLIGTDDRGGLGVGDDRDVGVVPVEGVGREQDARPGRGPAARRVGADGEDVEGFGGEATGGGVAEDLDLAELEAVGVAELNLDVTRLDEVCGRGCMRIFVRVKQICGRKRKRL